MELPAIPEHIAQELHDLTTKEPRQFGYFIAIFPLDLKAGITTINTSTNIERADLPIILKGLLTKRPRQNTDISKERYKAIKEWHRAHLQGDTKPLPYLVEAIGDLLAMLEWHQGEEGD